MVYEDLEQDKQDLGVSSVRSSSSNLNVVKEGENHRVKKSALTKVAPPPLKSTLDSTSLALQAVIKQRIEECLEVLQATRITAETDVSRVSHLSKVSQCEISIVSVLPAACLLFLIIGTKRQAISGVAILITVLFPSSVPSIGCRHFDRPDTWLHALGSGVGSSIETS